MKNKQLLLMIIMLFGVFVLGGMAVTTAVRLQQLSTRPVAPNVPESKPMAAQIMADELGCQATYTVPQNQCNGFCDSDSDCAGGEVCYTGFCRNPNCLEEPTCICPTPTPTVTPTPPPTCASSDLSQPVLNPNASITMTVNATMPVTTFKIAFFNADNVSGGIVQPVHFVNGVPYEVERTATAPTTSMTFTIAYADLNRPDLHPSWNGTSPVNLTINGYVVNNGVVSPVVDSCIEHLTKTPPYTPTPTPTGTVTPLPTPTVTPTPTSTPTPTVTPTPTFTPTPTLVPLACVGLTYTPTTVKLGDYVTFHCAGSGENIHHYEFRYSVSGSAYTSISPAGLNSAYSVPFQMEDPGSYVVQCRVCRSVDGSVCTQWGAGN